MKPHLSIPILLDGGLSTELNAQGLDLSSHLWTAQYLIHNPEAIEQAHTAYLKAGANIITSSSYQASEQGFIQAAISLEQAHDLLRSTVTLAKSAIAKHSLENLDSVPQIAASIGPYGAILADGSEFHGQYQITTEELWAFHAKRIEILDDMEFEWYACETLPSLHEAEILAKLLSNTTKKSWISFTCKDGNSIADGTSIEDCVRTLVSYPQINAIGINCTAPEFVYPLMQKIKPLIQNKLMVLYPNSGGRFDATTREWLRPDQNLKFLNYWEKWLQLDPDLVGGCCRIGSKEIGLLADRLAKV